MLTFAGILWRAISEVLVSKVKFYICVFTLFAVFNICSSINLPCPLPLVGLQISKCQLSPHHHFAVPLCLHPVLRPWLLSLLHRLLPSSGGGGGAWTSKTCGGWHCGHHLFPGSSRPVQYDGCLLRQQAAPEEAQEEKRWWDSSGH